MFINKRKYVLSIFFIIFITGTVSFYFFQKPSCSPFIFPYDAQKDRAFILDLFNKHWYWLVSEYSPDFSPEYMLDKRASSQRIENKGNLLLYVYRDPEPRGFIAYFKKNDFLNVWQILFLAVAQESRQKGYGDCLFKFVLEKLKKEGASTVELVTRTSNIPAQKIYRKNGFYEKENSDGFVYFEKRFV